MSNRIAPKLLAEFIGTFAFVFIGAGTAAVVGEGIGMPGIVAIAFAHGLAIMAFAFIGGLSSPRSFCRPYWAARRPASARLHSRKTSLWAPRPSRSRPLPAS
jgi:Major intrinsic protein